MLACISGRRGDGGFNGCCSGASIGDGGFTLACISGRERCHWFQRRHVTAACRAKKFALRAQKGPRSAFYGVLGELFRENASRGLRWANVVAPLALADLILTEQEKLKGCALIDFGAGVTSVTMYKDGSLAGLYVIPLGSHLITRDLMSLGMPEKEAERVKRTYGNAIWEKR